MSAGSTDGSTHSGSEHFVASVRVNLVCETRVRAVLQVGVQHSPRSAARRGIKIRSDAVNDISDLQCDPNAAAVELSVLIVEDDVFQQGALLELFEGANKFNYPVVRFTCTVAANAFEALKLLETKKDFTLVLLDVYLQSPPGCSPRNGDDIIPTLRRKLGDEATVLVLSGHAQLELVHRCILLGADSFQLKPVSLETVTYFWHHCLRKNRELFVVNHLGLGEQFHAVTPLSTKVVAADCRSS